MTRGPNPQRSVRPMKRVCVIIAVGVACFLGGVVVSPMLGWHGPQIPVPASEATIGLPAAVERAWFPPIGEYENGGDALDDERFEVLMAALDAAMSAEETLADFAVEAHFHLTNFARRLTVPRITEPQREEISDFLTSLGEKNPDHLQLIDRRKAFLTSLYSPKFTDDVPVFSGRVDLFLSNLELYPDGDFEDDQVDQILARLRAVLSAPEVSDSFEKEAATHLNHASMLLQFGRLSPEQLARVLAYIDEVAAVHPEASDLIGNTRYLIENLTPGRVAPDLTGTDTDGEEFSLEDYRGNIVALVFSGHWCGPCRVEYPFQRAMMSLYEDTNEDVVLLSVNSDPVLDTIRAVKVRESLGYRTWWDGHGEVSTEGPIATEWRVGAWPTIYILDEEGVIRFVGERGAAMIAAVDELLKEKRWAAFEASMLAPVGDPQAGGQ
ncbi:MAG: redoxin domain-containing protein [Gemmatimonadetes bacterium]|nr:redoxin domain-containing protein [Gemmatimonadota bacterium]